MKEGSPSLQTSHSLRELPPSPRHFGSGNLFRFFESGGDLGEVFVVGEVRDCYRVRLSHLFYE